MLSNMPKEYSLILVEEFNLAESPFKIKERIIISSEITTCHT